MNKYDRKNIRDSLIESKIITPEPYIYPMSAVRDEEIFRYLLFKYVRYVNCIVETGTYVGISALLLHQHCNILHTFDIVDHPERAKIWDFAGINDEIIGTETLVLFHHIKDDFMKAVICDKIKPDFCFIDGRHHGGVDVDFEILKKNCNKFLFHDYCPSKARLNGKSLYDYVYTYLEKLKKQAKIVEAKPPFMYLEF